MTMTAIDTTIRPLPGAVPVEEGPVVLAAKPFDGSDAPVAVARWLARREDRDLHVVSVLEQYDALSVAAGVPPLPRPYYDEERSAIAERIIGELARGERDTPRCRVDVLAGPGARTIVDVAHDRGARMIVIGTGRHDSLGRFVYGERAMQIVRIADRPVLVVPRSATAGFVRHAVVAVDFSPASLRAATAALPMLSRGSRLTLVHVKRAATPPDEAPDPRAVDGRCAELFARFLKLLPVPPGIQVVTRVLWGDAVTCIDDFARSHDVSLIACGRRQDYTLAERLFVGSVSAGLLRRVNCPLMIVPEQRDLDTSSTGEALTGVETWPIDEWPEQLEGFALRNHGKTVRVSAEPNTLRHGRCVAQDYALRGIAYDRSAQRLTIALGDTPSSPNVITFLCADVAAITRFTDVGGDDVRITIDGESGRSTLTMAT